MRELMKRHAFRVVLGVLLLVVAMSASATAATLITGKQIKNNTVTTADIKDGTLRDTDLAAATQLALRGATGPRGPAGPAGAPLVGSGCQIPDGPTGTVEMDVADGGAITFRCATPGNTDADGDGYSPDQGDCNDEDAAVHLGAEEITDGKDNNCDGQLGSFPAYSGPDGTDGVGVCHAGIATENTEPPNFRGPIVGEVTPTPEIPGDGLDNDCDGQTDEAG
jgi:hypothetical protein